MFVPVFEKSGFWARIAMVGTVAMPLNAEALETFSKSPKKNVLFFRIGPPRENPPWSRWLLGLGLGAGLKKSRAAKSERWKKYQALP